MGYVSHLPLFAKAICFDFLCNTYGDGPFRGAELAQALVHCVGIVMKHVDAWQVCGGPSKFN